MSILANEQRNALGGQWSSGRRSGIADVVAWLRTEDPSADMCMRRALADEIEEVFLGVSHGYANDGQAFTFEYEDAQGRRWRETHDANGARRERLDGEEGQQ